MMKDITHFVPWEFTEEIVSFLMIKIRKEEI
jgi:hypothetical protein